MAQRASKVTPAPPPPQVVERGPDRTFRLLTLVSGLLVLFIIIAIGVYLFYDAQPALSANTANFWTETDWFPNEDPPFFGIAALVYGTIITSVIALVVGFPIAFGIALFISHYAPRRLAKPMAWTIDLLAAVPSVVFGLWGIFYLNDKVIGVSEWLNSWFGWIPIFASEGTYGRSILLAGTVLAIMIVPIIASLSREVFSRTPSFHEEAALALGATRWEMIRMAVLPYGRAGVVAATMLGLGRALGETIAVAMVLSANFEISIRILEPGGNTIAANIANGFAEANENGRGALIASGLVLFGITLIVNVVARVIIYRKREFAGTTAA